MTKVNRHSHGGFIYGIVAMGLFMVSIFLSLVQDAGNVDFLSIIVGFLIIVSGFTALVGLVNSLKGRKEPNTFKKIIGLIINALITAFFIVVASANVLDIFKFFI